MSTAYSFSHTFKQRDKVVSNIQKIINEQWTEAKDVARIKFRDEYHRSDKWFEAIREDAKAMGVDNKNQ